MKNLFYYETILGRIGLVEERGFLTNLLFAKTIPPKGCKQKETETLIDAYEQLNKYLNKEIKTFTIPINPQGDKLLQQVLIYVMGIKYGKTITYKDLSDKIGIHQRTLTACLYKNPLPIIIPCHRVVGINNKITGYVSDINIKEKLLDLEK